MDINEIADIVSENELLNPFMEVVTQIMDIDDGILTSQTVENLKTTFTGMYTEEMLNSSRKEIMNSLEARGITRLNAQENLNDLKTSIQDVFNMLQPSENKAVLLHAVFDPLINIFEDVLEHYHNFDINLLIKCDENGKVPTYAHETDAAADLYAAETVVVPAHSLGNIIPTGIKIALPENWTAYIVPRSSMGTKTPLRLSNSVGVIDSDYRGPVGVIYDNISDSDYTINAGDRIAQLIVMPTYRFKPHVVDILPATERGEGGFGSSGK